MARKCYLYHTGSHVLQTVAPLAQKRCLFDQFLLASVFGHYRFRQGNSLGNHLAFWYWILAIPQLLHRFQWPKRLILASLLPRGERWLNSIRCYNFENLFRSTSCLLWLPVPPGREKHRRSSRAERSWAPWSLRVRPRVRTWQRPWRRLQEEHHLPKSRNLLGEVQEAARHGPRIDW